MRQTDVFLNRYPLQNVTILPAAKFLSQEKQRLFLPRKVLNISQLLLNNCFHISDKEMSNLHLVLHSI